MSAIRRWSKPTLRQRQIIWALTRRPGISIVQLADFLGQSKKRGAAIFVTVKRAIKRGFITAKLGKKANSYALFASPEWINYGVINAGTNPERKRREIHAQICEVLRL